MAETVQIETLAEAIKEANDLWRADDFSGMLVHYQALRVFFEDAPPEWQRHYFGNLALALQETGQPEQAVTQYQKALEVWGEGEGLDLATINANLAGTLLLLNRPDEALIYLSQPEGFYSSQNPIGPEEMREWALRLGNALETKARALSALGEESAVDTAEEGKGLLLRYCRNTPDAGRAIRTLAICWERFYGRKEA